MEQARLPLEVKADILQDVFEGAPEELSRGARGAIIGRFNALYGKDFGESDRDGARHLVLAWLFDRLGQQAEPGSDVVITGISSKALSNDQWWALSNWIGAWQDENKEWHIRAEFELEAMLVLTAAMQAYGEIPIGTPENRNWNTSLVYQAVTQLGGVITNATPEEAQAWLEHLDVALPDAYLNKPEPIFKKADRDVEL